MLKRILHISILITLNLVCFFQAYPKSLTRNYNSDSVLAASIKKIEHFKQLTQQKELNAFVARTLLVNSNIDNSQKNEVYFHYIKNLLNEGFIVDATAFIDTLKADGFFSLTQNQWKYHYWLALGDYVTNNPADGLVRLDSALIIMNRLGNCAANDYAEVYYYNGIMWQFLKNSDQAIKYYQISLKHLNDNKRLAIEINRSLSTSYSLKGEYERALQYINNALHIALGDKRELNINNISVSEVSLHFYADLLQSRAYVYREYAKVSPHKQHYLELSVTDCEKSIEAIEMHKRNLVFESDVIYLNSTNKIFYFKTIEALCRLYEVTGNDSLLIKALRYSEMDKVSALVYTIQRNKALYGANLPQALIDEMVHLNMQLSEVEAMRFEQQANIRLNDTALYALNMRLYDLVTLITEKEQGIEQQYPLYNKIKYDLQLPSLEYIFELSKNKAIIEYVISDNKLYTFVIVDGRLHFKHVFFPANFIENIASLQSMVSDVTKLNFSIEEQQRFTTLSAELYDALLRPFEAQLTNKNLLIVPDAQLSLIPFEILLKSANPVQRVDYASLDYLIKHHNISYAYSLTLMNKQTANPNLNRENSVFAMAPGYKNLAGNQGAQYIALRDARDNLGMLEGARKEVKMVGKMVMSKTAFDDDASENAFKTQAANYSILHLAMHTLVNNEEPLYSKLVFTPDADVEDDGLLNTYELANMDINADLVVLSACNTGFGKLNQGEGIVGLSRGFFQAGCKSLLATLWSVSDKSSLSIIDGFYDNLRIQKPKSESLSTSKRAYLSEAKGMWAHPFFWAGYIAIGDDEPLMIEKRDFSFYYVGGGLIILLLTIFVGFWYKKSR